MSWRLARSDFDRLKGEGNKNAMRAIVDSGNIPGILAYDGETPVGWCSVAPRTEFPRLERTRVLQPVDDKPVWSITCFFVAKSHRRKGITVKLLEAAVEYAEKRGCTILEGYPYEPRQPKLPDPFVWTGLASAFRKAGFREVLRRSDTRPIMRYCL